MVFTAWGCCIGMLACIMRSPCAHTEPCDCAHRMWLLQIGLPVQVGMLLVGLLLQNVGAVHVSPLPCCLISSIAIVWHVRSI